ncbi:MAG: TonB-dependent receptor domain-containing protein [Myxococcota bacterium]
MIVLVLAILPGMVEAQGLETGTISGRVFDGDSGQAIENATVILIHPDAGDGTAPRQEVTTSGPAGDYEFGEVPPGAYELTFVKAGYRTLSLTDFEVVAGQDNTADLPMPPQALTESGEVLELDAFVVDSKLAGELMNKLELRLDSDQMLSLLSSEDLSKYASNNVGDALKRMSGVNVVEGQFAVIRGLDDRYSSTLYNGAPVPSPDPNRQSVQLDLFPSEVVGNIIVSKTSAGDLPSNSAGGAIDIVTLDFPEQTTLSLSVAAGVNDRATDRFLRYYDPNPVGVSIDPASLIERDFTVSLAGRGELFDREVRFKLVANREYDFKTKEGFQETREPDRGRANRRGVQEVGDLAQGVLSLSRGRFGLTESLEQVQQTAFAAGGMDLDREGHHKIDGSVFYIRKNNDTIQRRENGFFPGFDYGPLLAGDVTEVQFNDFIEVATPRSPLVDLREEQDPADGIPFYTIVDEHRTFSNQRDLLVTQLNGEHDFDRIEGLSLDWAWNFARAKQDESAIRAIVFFEPDDPIGQAPTSLPNSIASLGPGSFAINNRSIQYNENSIDETQNFVRADMEYERELSSGLRTTTSLGIWYEDSARDASASVLLQPRLPGPARSAILGPSPQIVAGRVFQEAELGNRRDGISRFVNAKSNLTRKIGAINVGIKGTLWEDFDLNASVRLEDLEIESENDPFTGSVVGGSPSIFPSKYLFCDRLDNPAIPSEGVTSIPSGVTFNDQILGIDSPVDPVTGTVDRVSREALRSCINGKIDEQMTLPSVGIADRPTFRLGSVFGLNFLEGFSFEGLALRAAYSQTVARPSFRELSYYVTAAPGTDDLIVGNPQLGLSDVESWDLRAEYVWGEFGDLFAVSLFQKKIQDPIEVIVLRDALVVDESVPSRFRTFFNNRSGADLRGVEAEFRLHLGLGGLMGAASDFLDSFSIGANYTYIDATVERSKADIDRTAPFFIGNPSNLRFPAYKRKRRLFNQPEWIANADITFDRAEWGTRATLAYVAISEVLNAAGSVSLNANNEVTSFELDRYVDSFYQLDLVMSQDFEIPRVPGRWTIGGSIKNLTDTTRKIIYDQAQTADDIRERSFKRGRTYHFSLTYTFEF